MHRELNELYRAEIESLISERRLCLKLIAELSVKLIEADQSYVNSELYNRVKANLKGNVYFKSDADLMGGAE